MNSSLGGKYLIFGLNNEVYGMPVSNVCEINRMTTVTPVPQSAEYIRGVMNLRGKVIPVIDLRLRFGFPKGIETKNTCILVLENRTSKIQNQIFGVIVDSVASVIDLVDEQIDRTVIGKSDFIIGMGKSQDQVILLVDATQAFNSDSMIDKKQVS